MNLKLSNVSCKYGAPMGRPNVLPEDRNAKVKLRLVRLRWVDGDYDQGGVYWGNPGGSSIYWATDGATDVFVRAKSRVEAKVQVLHHLPNARFYR
jgi:hypothetical protein